MQLFEGYAGTSRSGLRAEIEAEQALERGERLLAMIEGHQHWHLAGPAAREARARLAEFGRHAQAGFAGMVVTDPRRLQLLMRRHVELYEEVIRQLTIENDRLKQQLEKQARVTQLDSRRRI